MRTPHNQATKLNNDESNPGGSADVNASAERHDDTFILNFGQDKNHWQFACTTSNGGRITSFQLNGHELLVPKNPSGMFGSTFWTAPENWGWPPPEIIDEGIYQGTINERSIITLRSDVDPQLNMRVEKTFSIDATKSCVHVDYTITNESAVPQGVAPWEITRVEKTGLTFYPQGDKTISGKTRGEIFTDTIDGINWYQHPEQMTDDAKLFDSSSENWIAHTDGTLLFIKVFEPATTVADGEGEIEIYACNNYVEIEEQGSYQIIASGQSTTWRVSWYLRELPKSLQHKRPSIELVDKVRTILT